MSVIGVERGISAPYRARNDVARVDGEERLQRLVDEHREVLVRGALALQQEKTWSLTTPVVLITPVEAKVVACSAIGAFLKVDSFVDSPLIKEWLELAKMTSPERALETMLNSNDEAKAEQFAEEYTLFREGVKERGSHAEISAGELASFNVKVRKAFDAKPQELGVIAQFKQEGRMGVITGCVAVNSLL